MDTSGRPFFVCCAPRTCLACWSPSYWYHFDMHLRHFWWLLIESRNARSFPRCRSCEAGKQIVFVDEFESISWILPDRPVRNILCRPADCNLERILARRETAASTVDKPSAWSGLSMFARWTSYKLEGASVEKSDIFLLVKMLDVQFHKMQCKPPSTNTIA